MRNQQKVAVISTGNGGQSLAACFAMRGYETALYARQQERVDMFPTPVFQLSGVLQGQARIGCISCDMRQVISGAHLIMVTTPSQYHHVVAREMAPHLKDGQVIVLNPGRTLGTYAFETVLRRMGCEKKVTVAEAETFILTCRCPAPGQVEIYHVKDNVGVAAHQPHETAQVVELLQGAFPTFAPAPSVLHTGFGNIGMIFHPLPVLMNLTRIEAGEKFLYYHNAISPMVADMIERLDQERVSVAERILGQAQPVKAWLADKYGASGDTLYECLQNTQAYARVYAPTDVHTRYVFEDIPTGCVPMACIGRRLGIPMPMTESVIAWASAVYNCDFFAMGRSELHLDIEALLAKVRQAS
nr:NAD/NADP-dependent octopine/nopaline dehydrogenase family protein [Maliibacterium massiliense]